GKLRKHRRYFIEKNIVGGRGGTRNRGPLLSKQGGKNTNCFFWCRLQRKPSEFPLLHFPEIVPRILGSINATFFLSSSPERPLSRSMSLQRQSFHFILAQNLNQPFSKKERN